MTKAFFLAATGVLLTFNQVKGQHLWWNLEGQRNATCLYGEITVLATHPAIYYCGANWHPGEPAGGYCGIQHNSLKERRTIFSIWDTSAQLHPKVIEADPRTIFNRFGGEGTGAHTHMLWEWKVGDTFQFFVQKQPGTTPDTTDTRYYIYDRSTKKWLHNATISNPNGGKKSVTTLGGGMNSFLENFSGKNRDVPKLALYRLWLGTGLDNMKCLTRAGGDGIWGLLHDACFLAEGEKTKLDDLFSGLKETYGSPIFGGKGKKLEPLSYKPMPADVAVALKTPPRSEKIGAKRGSKQ